MTLADLEIYLESKAIQNPSINHIEANGKKFFYVIDDPYELSEFDNALRSELKSFPAMILEFGEGMLDDNNANNYTDTMRGSFMIVDKYDNKKGTERPRQIRTRCLEIAKQILIQIRKDRTSQTIEPGKHINFRIDNVPYTPVGPMAIQYYGYMVSFEFICPFTF